MKRMTFAKALKDTAHIPVFMDENERQVLFDEAAKLNMGEQIIEVGCLYGGSTAMLGKGSNNECPIQVYDNFSWWPGDGKDPNFQKPTKELALKLLDHAGLTEVVITEADSLDLPYYEGEIGLLFIDGGHSLQYITNDLKKFGPKAKTILCHDYGNSYWTTIKTAVDEFLAAHPDEYVLDRVVGMVAVICQIPF